MTEYDRSNANPNAVIMTIGTVSEMLVSTELSRVKLARELEACQEDAAKVARDATQERRQHESHKKHLQSEVDRLTDALAKEQAATQALRKSLPGIGTPTHLSTYLANVGKLRDALAYLELAYDTVPGPIQLIKEVRQRTGWDQEQAGHLVESWLEAHPVVGYNQAVQEPSPPIQFVDLGS